MKRVSYMLALILAYALPAFAQIQGGSVNGIIKDEQGGVLPGVTVTAQGVDATQTFITEANGEYPVSQPGARPLQGDRGAARASPPSCARTSSSPSARASSCRSR